SASCSTPCRRRRTDLRWSGAEGGRDTGDVAPDGLGGRGAAGRRVGGARRPRDPVGRRGRRAVVVRPGGGAVAGGLLLGLGRGVAPSAHRVTGGRTMQRNPRWDVAVSTGCGRRAAGR